MMIIVLWKQVLVINTSRNLVVLTLHQSIQFVIQLKRVLLVPWYVAEAMPFR